MSSCSIETSVGFGKDPAKLDDLRMKELANGRLAMFAFGGAVTQSVLTEGVDEFVHQHTEILK